jgi:hypothetical protein
MKRGSVKSLLEIERCVAVGIVYTVVIDLRGILILLI